MKKFALAAVCTLMVVGFVIADDFQATITKVDGNKVYFSKGKKGEEKKEGTAEAVATVKVMKGVKGDAAGTFTAGDAIEKGLKNEMFSTISDKGVKAYITTDTAGKITQILVLKGKKGG